MEASSSGKTEPRPAGPKPKRDLTTGPIGRTLIIFSLPVLGSNILQSLNGTANAIWVSHTLGPVALTATSNANQVFFLMLGAVFGITMASNILIGQAMGARDITLARRIVGTSTTFFVSLAITVGVLGVLLTPHILDAMGTPPDARAEAITYLRVIFAAMPFIYFFSYLMMAQRGTGDSRTPFYFSLMNVALDVTFNPLLITGWGPFPRMGIAGSATSTLIAQTVTLAVMLVYLNRTRSILVIKPSEWRLLKPDFGIVRTMVVKGLPMGAQMIVVSLAAVTMMGLVNGYGSDTAAAYGAALQLWTYVQMPAMALGAAVSSMAAQNVGAGRMDRVEKVARAGAMYAILFTGVPILLILLLERFVLHAFLPPGSASIPIAAHINSLALWSFVPFGVAFVFSGVIRATGVVWPPLLAIVISLWGVRVPFANLMMPHWGADAVWISFPVGSTATLLLAGSYYLWGGWRKARILKPTVPQGAQPDTGMSPPDGAEESETRAQAAGVLKPAGR
ncbi:MATE family efflux transporter [Phenylobacterium deserti]|uniref:MATE family efflux transporter n=1 Tax=Phenylobacterium deserti TaxID=1914756 RepID=A0A328AR45_9CAUL|nr:MATE family efflux transporter [Phenylobacterium deserti]RAK57502.1 MATE family efflux transporter [Phenylobacterium deserti]